MSDKFDDQGFYKEAFETPESKSEDLTSVGSMQPEDVPNLYVANEKLNHLAPEGYQDRGVSMYSALKEELGEFQQDWMKSMRSKEDYNLFRDKIQNAVDRRSRIQNK